MNRRSIAGGAAAAFGCAAANAVLLLTQGRLGLLNDFYIYWSAARVLNDGGNAYSLSAVTRVHEAAGLPGLMGAGYSYPPIFVELMRPLAMLPPPTAAAIFWVISLVALWFGVTLLLASIRSLSWPQALLLGALAGLFPPVAGSLWVGQANLLLLPALALAFRGVAPALWLMVGTSVKLYPGTGALALAGRRDLKRQLGLGALAASFLLVGPLVLGAGGGGFRQMLSGNLTPDTYLTNQSLMGFLTRMAMWQGWPLNWFSTSYVYAASAVGLAIFTTALVWRCRARGWEGCLALSVCLGTLLAPRNSLWNFTPLLLCFAYAAPRIHGRPWLIAGLVAGFGLIALQPAGWSANLIGGTIPASAYADPLVAWTSSLGLYGGLMIGAVCGRLLIPKSSVSGHSR